MKHFFTLIVAVIHSVTFAQTNSVKIIEEIGGISNTEQALKYLRESNRTGDIYTCTSLDSTRIDMDLLSSSANNIIEYRDTAGETTHIFKVLKKESTYAYKVNYIYLDNDKLDIYKIDSLRGHIMNQLKQGVSFESLARKYSMDANSEKGGILDWFTEDIMMTQFVEAIKAHETGAVFKVEIPEKNWYYVVLNSHKPVKIDRVTALFIEVNN